MRYNLNWIFHKILKWLLINFRKDVKLLKKAGDFMFKKLTNKLKFSRTKRQNPGNVNIPSEFEVTERKKDVDANEK